VLAHSQNEELLVKFWSLAFATKFEQKVFLFDKASFEKQ